MNLEQKIEKLGFKFEEQTGFYKMHGKMHGIFWNDEFVGLYNDEIDIMTITHDDCPKVYTCDMKHFEEWCAQEFVDLIKKKRSQVVIQKEIDLY